MNRVIRYGFVVLINCLLLITQHSFAQHNDAARYEIDAKRVGVSPISKDALPRSREFIRLDSTYYVGWLYEGIYKYDRSADFLGYKNAIPPLQKALNLLEKDYGSDLHSLFSSLPFLAQHFNRYNDLYIIFNALRECYGNIEMPDSVIALLDRIDRYHFRKDYFGTSANRAWTYHRNRFLTSDNYSFLKNSVAENEKMALQCSYRGLGLIKKNKEANDAWFGPMQSEPDKQNIYFYLAMLHCYNKNYDSSEYYYQQLAEHGTISWNNYGSLQHEIGNFANAISYYTKDQFKSSQRMLREPYYYLPQLFVYGGKTKAAITMVQQVITESGSTPGFGWYNIALARAYLYDGQTDSCEFTLNRAANFKEMHIGTTLTQTQYEFTINLLRVQLADKKMSQIKFVNRGWWYSPTALYQLASLKIEKLLAEYVVVNELAFNPERNRLVYDLFCSEATSSFDEAWYLLKDFSPAYFQKKYEGYQRTDTRQNVQRYFKLFDAKFKWEEGKDADARKDFESIEKTTVLDTANEKLFLGRLYEGLAKSSAGDDNKNSYDYYRDMCLEVYPQLVPFTGVKVQMKLNISGADDEVTKKVIGELNQSNVEWVEQANDAPVANIQFTKKSNKYEAVINVRTHFGKYIAQNERLIFQQPKGVGNELALRLFGKGGALMFEPPQPKQ